MISSISLNGQSVTVVQMPTSPGMREVEFSVSDNVATVVNPYTKQTQAQKWLGGDMWGGTMTLPPLKQADADEWIAFLMQLRGMANAFQLGDPAKVFPRGVPLGAPVVNGVNAAGSETLATRGWPANKFRLLMRGDYVQVGYRLHRVLDPVNSDGSGLATISVWPSLREATTDGEAISLNHPKGLWRLASNDRKWSSDYRRLSRMSFQIMEYR